ncbi:MAG: hypothetical protein OXI69_13825 [Acidobacteriota bacterium]|nr:hypothetical protein [Acidobacteriota bacterium]
MDKVEALIRKIQTHPAFHGGPADEEYWLDFLEATLAEFGTYEFLVEMQGEGLRRRPEMLALYILASQEDRLAWDVLEALVRRLRRGGKPLPNRLAEWWIDAAAGVLKKPKGGGRVAHRNRMRDLAIAAAVNGIRDVTGIPYEFDQRISAHPRTACHVVAERLNMSYGAIRSIWRNMRPHIERARDQGLILPPGKKQRRR